MCVCVCVCVSFLTPSLVFIGGCHGVSIALPQQTDVGSQWEVATQLAEGGGAHGLVGRWPSAANRPQLRLVGCPGPPLVLKSRHGLS